MSMSTIVRSSRVPFLILTPVCILLGAALVAAQGGSINGLYLVLALIGGLLAHISVNTLNEYQDFESGLDLNTQRTPFSGGSGALPEHPEHKQPVLYAAWISLLLTIGIGLYFVWLYGVAILPLGVVGVLIILLYTRWINRRPWLCLLAPGLGFGLLMVMGTQFVLTGEYWASAFWLGLIPFLLVNNLLLLNQYPDVEADAAIGRYHFPIAYGVTASNLAYGANWLLSVSLVVLYVAVGWIPFWGLLALLPLGMGALVWRGIRTHGFAIGAHPGFMAMNVMMTLFTPLLIGIVLFWFR
ncbi:MAG: prenyltransferase [Pseudomonadales bacterium]|nr:prenyltransferase [Pseudomonadales bacterium]